MEFIQVIMSATIFVIQRVSSTENMTDLETNERFCSGGWHPFGELCYKSFLETMNFENAEKECVKLGGHLAAIHSSEIQDFITAKFLREMLQKPFIGLSRNQSTGKFHWTDGTETDFTAWYPGEPNGDPTGKVEDCVEMVFSHILRLLGKWNDMSCHAELPFICQKLKDSKTEHPMNGSNQCSRTDNAIYYKNSCYYLTSSLKTWEEAETYCVEQYNGHLASVTDTMVQTFLHYEVANGPHRSTGVWIGIRLKPDDIALWSSGWYVGFNNWKDKKTAGKVSSTLCVSMMSSTGEWTVDSCDRRLPFICENSSAIPPPRLNATIPGLSCPSGENEWIDLGGDYCYIFHPETYVTWEEANFICMRKGGTLASIHSRNEEQVFAQFFRYSAISAHIGLLRSFDGEFVWIDGSPVNYKNWVSTEPNDEDKMCVEAWLHAGKGWSGITCGTRNLFMCSVVKKGSVKSDLKEEKCGSVKSDLKEEKCGCVKSDLKEDKCDSLPTLTVVCVVLGVLLVVITVTGVVFCYLKLRMNAQQGVCKKFRSNSNHNPNEHTRRLTIYEHISENMDMDT